MDEHREREHIRSYFSPPNLRVPIGVAGTGLFIFLFLSMVGGGVILTTGIALLLSRVRTKRIVTDAAIDATLSQDLSELQVHAMARLGLEPEDLESEPLVVIAPVISNCLGVPTEDLLWRRGRDGRARFGVLRVTILFLSEHYLSSYVCDLDFLRRCALNEKSSQYHYKDVIAVTMGERSPTVATPGEPPRGLEGFTLSFVGGDKLRVAVSTESTRRLTGSPFPATGIEKAVASIKAMLRTKTGEADWRNRQVN